MLQNDTCPCGSGLARECGVSGNTCISDTPHS
ncbi:SEC-C metal-binding domain-containing protein, partial [Pseudomonas fluorescens]